MHNPFISIHIPSNKPQNLLTFFNQMEKVTSNYHSLEILINLDEGDTQMSAFLDRQAAIRPFTIKYLSTFTGGFYNSWAPINDLLAITHPNAYFLIFISDEMNFETKGWDEQLISYVGYYPDHIFRLRASQFRYRNYIDLWECGFAPDSICFYTRRWLEINKNWAPCFSSDAFQQCVAYYLFTSDPFTKEQYNRDIPLPHMAFYGEGVSIGMTPEAARKRARDSIPAWFILMSHQMQTEAYRRAMLIKANIIKQQSDATIFDNKRKKKIILIRDKHPIITLSYKHNRLKFFWRNFIRKPIFFYYTGGGDKIKPGIAHLPANICRYLIMRHWFFDYIYKKIVSWFRKK